MPGNWSGCYSRDTQKPDSYRAFSYPNYADLRDNNPVFTSLMAHNLAMVGLSEGDSTRRMFARPDFLELIRDHGRRAVSRADVHG